jgi:hypothetical protein
MTNAIIENNYNQENIFMFTCFALKERNVMKNHWFWNNIAMQIFWNNLLIFVIQTKRTN